jgi:hypothetical protein
MRSTGYRRCRAALCELNRQGVALVRSVLLGSAPPPFPTLAAAAFGHPPCLFMATLSPAGSGAATAAMPSASNQLSA